MNYLKCLLLLLLPAIFFGCSSKKNNPKAQKPNFILFMADDCSYYDLGCYGSTDSKTPNIDKFTTQGIRFTKGYQAAPMCSPTRHNLYTGLWPVKTGAYPNHTMTKEGTLSIVQHLKPAGYQVALIGKSHVNPKSVFPWDFYAPLVNGEDIDFAAVDSFISSCMAKKQPFCLFVMSHQPHTPWTKGDPAMFDPQKIKLPPFYVDIPETRKDICKYLAEINFMDNEFGTLLQTLDKYKLTDKSVVVYLSEQGNSLPFAKWTCYDAGVHSAFIVRWPGIIKPKSTSEAIVEYLDIVPTFLEIADINPAGPLDGKSIVPLLKGEKKENKQYTFSLQTTRGIYSGSEYYGIRSVADKKYRYIVNLTPEATFQNTETKGSLFKKWIEKGKTDATAKWITEKYQHRPAIELYDLENDKYCMNNIADKPENKSIVERMDKVLREWMVSCGDKGQKTEMEALKHQYKNAKRKAVVTSSISTPQEIKEAFASHDHAIHIKDGWIRDPFIIKGLDGFFYLTGTTQGSSVKETEKTKYNSGLGNSSLVGYELHAWKTKDFINWESLGVPFTLKDGIWFKTNPEKFKEVPKLKWRLWAPEFHYINGKLVLIHTSPSPVAGANMSVANGIEPKRPWSNPLGEKIGRRHDPSLFQDDDGTWWMIWGAASIVPLKSDLSDFAGESVDIYPVNKSGKRVKIGHEGCLMRKINGKYVLFGTGWSTGKSRKGSYNLYYTTADNITGPYSERKFVGRFLGHGTPFQDDAGQWWCTAFFNANIPPLSRDGIQTKDLSQTAQTINPQGVTLVPLEVKMEGDELIIRAIDPDYAIPGSDEAQKF